MASDYDACGPVPFEAPHGVKPGLQAPVVCFDPVVGILSGVVKCGGPVVGNESDEGVGPVSGDLSRLAIGVISMAKNVVAAFRSRFFDRNTSMSCPYCSTAR